MIFHGGHSDNVNKINWLTDLIVNKIEFPNKCIGNLKISLIMSTITKISNKK